MGTGSIFVGKTRNKADRMGSSTFARRLQIQMCGKIIKGLRCEQQAAISKGNKHRCVEHL